MKKILLIVLALGLVTGCSTAKNNEQNNTENISELSLTDENVVKIINDFRIDYKIAEGVDIYNYINQELTDSDIVQLAFVNSKGSVKIEKDCDSENNLYNDDNGTLYSCEYLTYSDLNKNYNSLTGKDLLKSSISFNDSLVKFLYDDVEDMFRILYVAGGGGEEYYHISKLEKAEKQNEYIYIYEKIIFVSPDYENGGFILIKPSDVANNVLNAGVEIGEYAYDENNPSARFDKMIEDHIDKFETFKWSFKLNSNGEYVYDSLTLVK